MLLISVLLFISFCHCQSNSSSTSNSNACGLSGNTETICSPKTGDTWKNGTYYPITWNTMYPTYVASFTLDIYIYFVQNYQNVLIKKIPNVSTTKGTYPILVDDTWRLDNSTSTYESIVYIVTSDINPENELLNRFSDFPPPIHFFVEQLAILPHVSNTSNATTTLSTSTISSASPLLPTTLPTPSEAAATPSTTNMSNKQAVSSDNHTVQPWVIAAVVLACLAVLGACLAIIWIVRHSRKRKLVHGEKGHLELNSTASSSMFPEKLPQSSMSLATPPAAAVMPSTPPYMLDDAARPQSTASFSNVSSRSEPPLTSTDALLIADTFRQRMRRPEWLLKTELEAEGTPMKKVGKQVQHLLENNK